MLLFQQPYCKIFYQEDVQAVHLDWGMYASHDQFQEACNAALAIMIERNAKKMIADNSKVAVVSIENQNWLTRTWFPAALREGFKYSAVILKEDFYVNYAMTRIENNIDNEVFTVQHFDNINRAKDWLLRL